jgi:hypothetical protein
MIPLLEMQPNRVVLIVRLDVCTPAARPAKAGGVLSQECGVVKRRQRVDERSREQNHADGNMDGVPHCQ